MINPELKTALTVIIMSVLILYPFNSVYASLSGVLFWLKEFVLDLIARLITRTFLTLLSNEVVSKINELGRDGGPAIIRDWRDFKQDAQYRGEDIFRAMLADAVIKGTLKETGICDYMGKGLQKVFGKINTSGTSITSGENRIYGTQSYALKVACSTNLTAGQIQEFRDDFTKGGWEAWDELIRPENNLHGVFLQSSLELSKQREFEEGVDISEGESGSGFLSARTDSEGSADCITSRTDISNNGKCLKFRKISTPAKILGDSAAATIDREFGWLTSSDELAEVLVKVREALISRLANFVVGAALPGNSGNDIGDDLNKAAEEKDVIGKACAEDCFSSRINAQIEQNCGNIPKCNREEEQVCVEPNDEYTQCVKNTKGEVRGECSNECSEQFKL